MKTRAILTLWVLVVLLAGRKAMASEFYVDPNGTAGGDGSAAKPWDLATTLVQPAAVQPGDTIILAGGTYPLGASAKEFFTKLTGTADKPITLRPAAGARATVDLYSAAGQTDCNFYIGGAHTIYRDIEFTSSNPDREKRGSWQIGAHDTGGGEGVKAVDLILHDISNVGLWRSAVNAQLYGCLIYHNGENGPDGRGHGHAAYIQNLKGTKLIAENICFNQFSCGLAPHGTGDVVGLKMQGNVCFNNGVLSKSGHHYNYFLWAGKGTSDVVLKNNYGYVGAGFGEEKAYGTDLVCGKDLTIEDNYFVGGGPAFSAGDWDKLTVHNNRIFSAHLLVSLADPNSGPGHYDWDNNQYTDLNHQAAPFLLASKAYSWDPWRKSHEWEAKSTLVTERPVKADLFVRPNQFEDGRANVIIYNWPRTDTVKVKLAPAGLKKDDGFVLLDAQNFFGKPVVEGKWTGEDVVVPMKDLPMVQPTGSSGSFVPPKHTGVDFGVFVLRKAAVSR